MKTEKMGKLYRTALALLAACLALQCLVAAAIAWRGARGAGRVELAPFRRGEAVIGLILEDFAAVAPGELAAARRGGANAVFVQVDLLTQTAAAAPYDLPDGFLDRLAEELQPLFQAGLRVVLSARQDEALLAAQPEAAARLSAAWRQVDEKFGHRPDAELWYEVGMEAGEDRWGAARVLSDLRASGHTQVLTALGDWSARDARLDFAAQNGLVLALPVADEGQEAAISQAAARLAPLDARALLRQEGALDAARLRALAEANGLGWAAR